MKRRSPVPTLRARLAEAEETLDAIRTGGVDALVVSGPRGAPRTLTIEGAVQPYHILLDAMSDGAALLTEDGTILFANRRLGELTGVPPDELNGTTFRYLLAARIRPAMLPLQLHGQAEETLLGGPAGKEVPVRLALSSFSLGGNGAGTSVRMAIITDLTAAKQAEATRLELMRRLITIEDAERRRIARELHDETGQSLTALLVGLRAIEHTTEKPAVRAAAQRLRTVAAQTVDDVGRLARGLHPSILDDLGLLAAARRYVTDYAKAYDLEVKFTSEGLGTRRLRPLVQTTMYRILQEALTNVARHARAERVAISLKLDRHGLVLEVSDDGIGFDVSVAEREPEGLGLHGMGERLVLLGGTLGLSSTRGKGTQVRAWAPAQGLTEGIG